MFISSSWAPCSMSVWLLSGANFSIYPYTMQIHCVQKCASVNCIHLGHLSVLPKIKIVLNLILLSCSFITPHPPPQTTASSCTELQDSHLFTAYQVQCFTTACKLIPHSNSNSTFMTSACTPCWISQQLDNIVACTTLMPLYQLSPIPTQINSHNLVHGSLTLPSPSSPFSLLAVL